MENTVTLELEKYDELIDAKQQAAKLKRVFKEKYKFVCYSYDSDYEHQVFSKEDYAIRARAEYKKLHNELWELKRKFDSALIEINQLKKPWYKRIFKRI